VSYYLPEQGLRVLSFVASGTLGSGVTVILKSDGTVEAVAETAISQAVGTPVVFEAAASTFTATSYDSTNQKIIIAYQDIGNSNYGTAVVGTVSGTSISFGSAVVFESAYTQYIASTYDSTSGKIVVAYADATNSGYGTAIVGTVSGTSISFGSATVFESANTGDISATYDANSGKVVISYFDSGNSSYGTAVVGTVSGTSISFGSATVFNSAQSNFNFVTYDSNAQKVVIAYRDLGNSNYGTAIVGTVSGTSISFGAESVFNSNLSTDVSSAYDANAQKVVIAYRDYGNSSYGTAVVGTVSGTNISFGSATVFNAGTSDNMAVVYDANAQKIVIPYTDTANSNYGTLVVGTISGTSISFGAETVFEAATATNISSAYDANAKKVVISYRDATNSEYGTSVVFQNASTATNSADFIGITDQAIADTATGAVIVQGGVSEKAKGPITSSVGTATTFSASTAPLSSIVYDEANNKVVVVFRDASNSSYGTAKVGTVSGTSISWGTPTVFQSTGLSPSEIPQVTYDPDTEQIITAYLVGTVGRYAVGSVSGTTISFGSSGAFETGNTTWISLAYDTANSRVVIAYRYNTAPATDDGYAVVGTVSGTSISFGSRVLFDGGSVSYTSTVYDSNAGKIVIVYNSSGAKAVVGTVSGTSISFGSIATITMTLPNMTYSDLVYDAGSQKVVFVTRESLTPFYGLALVGTVSGTSISFGTEVEFTADGINWMAATYDSTLGKTIICYEEQTDIGKFVLGTVSGTSISFTSPEIFNASATDYVRGATYDSNQQAVVVTFTLTSAPYYGKATAISLTAPLTPNTDYYVQADGSLSTTVSSVPAGRALSSTSILLEG
jgi:hypothetical protein